MLRIPIEIHPFGDSNFKRIIGEITIANVGTNKNRPKYGDYSVGVVFENDGKVFSYHSNIKNHLREDGWLELLHKATGELLKIAKKSEDKEFQNS